MRPIAIFSMLFAFLFGTATGILGQKVSGVVTSFKTIPLQNAIVKSLTSGKTVNTDSLGRFSMEVGPDDIFLISAAGFIERRIRVGKSHTLYVNLKYKFDETSFRDAVGNNHITANSLNKALRRYPGNGEKDYSRYQNIYELIRDEIKTVRVNGTNIYNIKAISFTMSQQVLYVVDGMVVTDISFVSPSEVRKIEFLEDIDASEYGVRGANGVIKITLRKNYNNEKN
jgi:hypothetical protein